MNKKLCIIFGLLDMTIIENDDYEVAIELINHGADLNVINAFSKTFEDMIRKNKES